jgi:RHS repeat-associated protein
MPGGDADAARLEQDTLPAYTSTRSFGRVLYTNGAELDHPLDIIRIGYSQSWPGPVAIMPLYNWRGIADGGHFSGKMKQCVNASVDSTCVQISWPAANVNPFMAPYADYAQSAWIGEVPQQQRDATGLIYMRNRYYDPNSGQFTQQDPAGLAGGANLYGFANGDPVTYGDPYGLAADGDGGCCGYAAAKVGPPPPQLPRLHITWHDVREFINHHGVDVIMAVIPIGLERDGGNMIARLAGRELEPQGTLVIGKMAALERGVAADEYTLLPQMTENLGSPRANWARNDGLLRRAMGRGDPIRDASVDVHGRLLDETGFLRAERNVLRNHGWTYDPASHYWQPPGAR